MTSSTSIPSCWLMPLLFTGVAFLFLTVPGIDLAASAFFYEPNIGFPLGNSIWSQMFYIGSPRLVLLWIVILVIAALMSFWRRFRWLRRHALFLLAVLIVGPGLLVNGLLKEHWGRARPHQIVEFGGDKQFTPAWIISDQCTSNCSFVSGHAAGAFSLMALAWVLPRRRWFWIVAGAIWGLHIGLVRLAQGGHFLSDVIFAGFVVYFTAALLARWIFYQDSLESP